MMMKQMSSDTSHTLSTFPTIMVINARLCSNEKYLELLDYHIEIFTFWLQIFTIYLLLRCFHIKGCPVSFCKEQNGDNDIGSNLRYICMRSRKLSRFSRVRLCDPTLCGPPVSSVHGSLQVEY